MHGQAALYLILGGSFVVALVIMWRMRLLSIEARIEVPPEEPSSDGARGPISAPKLTSLPPPASWEVSDAIAEGGTLQPVRAGSLRPLRQPSQRPVTLMDGSAKLSAAPITDPSLPVPVRRLSLEPARIRAIANDDTTALARASDLPVPLRQSHRPPPSDDDA